MGLDVNGTKFLLYARKYGVSYSKTATIGRQELLLTAPELWTNLSRFSVEASAENAEKLVNDSDGFAEGFFKILGAEEVVSFDASTYENASVAHDFNTPVSNEF